MRYTARPWLPSANRWGRAARVTIAAPNTFGPNSSTQSSSPASCSGLIRLRPTVYTSASSPPSRSTAAFTMASAAAGEVTSQGSGTTSGSTPSRSARRAAAATTAPRAASSTASPRPMPLEAPTTRTR